MMGLGYLMLLFFISESLAKSYLQTNEVVERHTDDYGKELFGCTPNSVCGYLQANIHGINKQRRCICERGSECPMSWDASDGHSVTQGSDQYKFCGAAPVVEECQSGVTAYTSRLLFSKETDQTLLKSDHVNCICPEGHNHVMSNQKYDFPDEETEEMLLTYVCAPLEVCQSGDYCKTISETAREYLVQRKCLCPSGLRCPTNASIGVKTTPMGQGLVHFVRCQR